MNHRSDSASLRKPPVGVREERREGQEKDTDAQRRGELWVLGKQKQEVGGRHKRWGTDRQTDRTKIPTVVWRKLLQWHILDSVAAVAARSNSSSSIRIISTVVAVVVVVV